MSEKKQSIKENFIAQANNLESLIDYQTNSVVSQTIIGKKAGTVTMFAFERSGFKRAHGSL